MDPVLLLVHGIGSTRAFWDPILPLLPGYTCVAVDVPGFDARPRLPQLRERGLPALVGAGEHEGNEADQRELADLLGARFVALPGTSHLAPAEAPSAFVDELRPFLATCTEGTTWR